MMQLEETLQHWQEGRHLPDEIKRLADIHEFNSWHDETTYEHTLKVVNELRSYEHPALLQLMCWLHDIGKATTLVYKGGKTTFPGHEAVSAQMATPILTQLVSAYDQHEVCRLIHFHGNIHDWVLGDWQPELNRLNVFNFPTRDLITFGYVETVSSRLRETKPNEYKQRIRGYVAMAAVEHATTLKEGETPRTYMTIERVLSSIGLSANEIKTYLTLNDHGSMKAGRIAKLAKMDRSSCYHALTMLLDKASVSYVLIGKVKWFQAVGPRRLLEYLKEQQEDVKAILPELQQRHKASKQEGQVRLFKGVKGVKAIFGDIIRSGKDNYVFGSEGQFSQRMPEYALQFMRLKKENGIKTQLICRKGRKELDISSDHHRYLDVAQSPAVTNIYGDKIAIVIWTDEPEGIIIENAAAAKAYKSYFDVLWKVGE